MNSLRDVCYCCRNIQKLEELGKLRHERIQINSWVGKLVGWWWKQSPPPIFSMFQLSTQSVFFLVTFEHKAEFIQESLLQVFNSPWFNPSHLKHTPPYRVRYRLFQKGVSSHRRSIDISHLFSLRGGTCSICVVILLSDDLKCCHFDFELEFSVMFHHRLTCSQPCFLEQLWLWKTSLGQIRG
jgi:hypothetical protein